MEAAIKTVHQNLDVIKNAGGDALNIAQQVRDVSSRAPSMENVISPAPPIPAYNAVTRVETVT